MKLQILVWATAILFWLPTDAFSQTDTIRVSVKEFIELAKSRSSLLQVNQQQVNLAQNRYQQARALRILPQIELTTAHGLVPGVRSSDPDRFSDRMLYLDPNLENDWENWGIFTRAEISAIQPVYTWGAISSAIQAAKQGVYAAQAEFDIKSDNYEIQLYELYYSMLLARELQTLIERANRDLQTAQTELNRMFEEGENDLEEADLFQFRIFTFQFQTQVDEVSENKRFLQSAWNLALANDNSEIIYLPAERFLDPLSFQPESLDAYEVSAIANRPEFIQVQSAQRAAQYGLNVAKSANYPTVIMGFSAAFARTPNRPRQANPFIRNSANFENVVYGIGLRQNLNFNVNRENINRSQLQLRQATYARNAVSDGIRLELRENYRRMMMSFSRMENTREALDVSNEWLRMEQIEYDLGFGEVKNLVDAMRSTLELEVQLRQRIFDFNVNIGKLNKAAGLPIVQPKE
ncbi:MAG: TolC family protein [Bacteroidetes bacterium]|nr:TolC family protein [Bacteroidota bacterium]MCH8523445.1 TolC family protein [Balneolales bacterium]